MIGVDVCVYVAATVVSVVGGGDLFTGKWKKGCRNTNCGMHFGRQQTQTRH